MPKYGQVHFGRVYFGEDEPRGENYKRSFANIPLGIRVRRQIGKQVIFRVRRGNGHAGAIAGIVYQDKYGYVVPGNINNAEGKPHRAQWIAAVDYWRNILSTAEKKAYNVKATKGFRMSGYNLFMRAAMNGEIAMYVDRGDPASSDFTLTDFTRDGAWHSLDLSAFIPVTARAVLIDIDFDNTQANKHITLRKNGNTNNLNHFDVATKVAGQDEHAMAIITPDSGRLIEYNITSGNWDAITFSVRGWWT